MTLDQKVLSYELSKKLDEKGIVLDTEFYWAEFYNKSSNVPDEQLSQLVHDHEKEEFEERPYLKDVVFYPAPLLVEMLEVIERLIKAGKIQQIDITLREERKEIYVFYGEYEREAEGETIIEKTAQTILHLLENGHITLEDINK
jgi:hypothetical protein